MCDILRFLDLLTILGSCIMVEKLTYVDVRDAWSKKDKTFTVLLSPDKKKNMAAIIHLCFLEKS